jgi:hypothetical protein
MNVSTLPTLDEVPPVPNGTSRDDKGLVRLSIIPRYDTELRAMGVKLFVMSEHQSNTVGGTGKDGQKIYHDLLLDFSSCPARTPGGLAWKLVEVTDMIESEINEAGENWSWWKYLAKSAVSDALELERTRQAAVVPDPLFDLARRCEESQAHIRHLEKTREEDDPEHELKWQAALNHDRALHEEVRDTPATTLVGVAMKTIVAGMIKRIGFPAGAEAEFLDIEDFILLSAADDAKRLLGC